MVPHVGTEPVYDLPAPDSVLVLIDAAWDDLHTPPDTQSSLCELKTLSVHFLSNMPIVSMSDRHLLTVSCTPSSRSFRQRDNIRLLRQ
jgi:hypothetical protein